MCAISIRSVIAAFCVTLIVVTASVALSVTYSFSLAAAQEIAEDHAVALAAKAKGDVEAFINQPVGLIAGLQYMFKRDAFPLPSVVEPGNPQWYRWWWQTLVSSMRSASFAYQFAVFGFNDGNYAGCKLLTTTIPAGLFQCRVFLYSERLNTPGMSAVFQEDYWIQNYSLYRNASALTTYDPRTRSWWTATPHAPATMTWSSVYLSAMPTLPIVDINAAMFNASGAFLGIGSFTFELGQLSTFITSLQTTPNTHVFLLDNEDALMASSYTPVPYLKETEVPSNFPAASVPSGCVMSDVANGATRSLVLCRFNVTTYPYGPLQALQASAAQVVRTGTNGRAVRMDLGGTTYYVSVAPIATPLAAGMGWRVVLLMPELDIIHGIIDGRNAAIYIAVALLVVTSLIALCAVSCLLAPLGSLADRMYRAATFEDDSGGAATPEANADASTSHFSEVRTIQEAFTTLSGELTKVKSYLPQSVLAALYGDACSEDDDEGDADTQRSHDDAKSSSASMSRVESSKKFGADTASLRPAPSESAYHQRSSSMRSMSVVNAPGKRKSLQSTVAGGGGAPGPSLNTMLKLSQRKVTVLIVNVAKFHELVKATTPDDVLRLHGAFVDLVTRVVKENKGVLDGFSGDRFTVTFNAVTSVGNHACAAATCALAIANATKMNGGGGGSPAAGNQRKVSVGNGAGSTAIAGTTCGIASGAALVGNMGNAAVKRFCVLGPCIGHAALMERLCKRHNEASYAMPPRVSVLMCGQAINDAENFFELLFVNVVVLPGFTPSEKKRSRVAVVAGPKSVSCDEWMYQLEEGSNASCYGLHNEAFHKVLMPDNGNSCTNDADGRAKLEGLIDAALRRPRTDAEDPVLYDICREASERLRTILQCGGSADPGTLAVPPAVQGMGEGGYADPLLDYVSSCIC